MQAYPNPTHSASSTASNSYSSYQQGGDLKSSSTTTYPTIPSTSENRILSQPQTMATSTPSTASTSQSYSPDNKHDYSNFTHNDPNGYSSAALLPESSIHPKLNIGNPLPVAMNKRVIRATRVISEYLNVAQEQAVIPESIFKNCKGLIFLSMVKGAYLWGVRFASGIVLTRLADGRWSAPSAISCLGVGFGAQCGLEFTDAVIVLRDDNAINAFGQLGNVTFGANLGLCIGPWGRSAEASLAATCALTYAFSKTRGIFGGLSMEGTIFFENRGTNEKMYGKGVTARQILNGMVNIPEEVSILHNAIESRFPSHPSNVNNTNNNNNNNHNNNHQNEMGLPSYQAHVSGNANGYSRFSNEKEKLLS